MVRPHSSAAVLSEISRFPSSSPNYTTVDGMSLSGRSMATMLPERSLTEIEPAPNIVGSITQDQNGNLSTAQTLDE